MIVDDNGALEKSADVTDLFFEKFSIATESTGVDASWINVNNERHNRSIHNMVRSGLTGSSQNVYK